MADTDGDAIDPRYDPAFQRGFDGQIATGVHGQSTLRRTAAVNPGAIRSAGPRAYGSPASASAAAPGVAASDPGVGSAAAATLDIAPTAAPVATAGTDAPVSPTVGTGDGPTVGSAANPRELARNPFIVALIALAAALILAGIFWAYEGFSSIVTNGGTRNEVEFWAAQTMSFGAPLVLVVGLAVVAALLVLFSRSWQRSRG